MKRHNRDNYYVVGEGILTSDRNGNAATVRPSAVADVRRFRFSRLGPVGEPVDDARRLIFEAVATAMTTDPAAGDPESGPPFDSGIPAGFTYLAQKVDHDMTFDATAAQLGQDVTVDELVQGRSPALDLDSLYGRGPDKDPQFYAADGVHIKTGTTVIRFHNRVVDQLAGTTPSALLFPAARATVVRHYQWMLRTDFLPRIVEPDIVTDVFTNGRKFFEVPGGLA